MKLRSSFKHGQYRKLYSTKNQLLASTPCISEMIILQPYGDRNLFFLKYVEIYACT